MARKLIHDTKFQIRVSKELKEKAIEKANGKSISDYVRELVEKDCEEKNG